MNFIKQTALSLGFDACGIAKTERLSDDAVFLENWLVEGQHADMHYLERNFEKRVDPRELVPGCKSVVVVLMNYFPEQKQNPTAPQIAKYSYSKTDYHLVLKSKLKQLEQRIADVYGSDCIPTKNQHLFVDSAPVLERRWAERAGLGWIGKHTQLIHPGLGSYTFIGILMLNIELDYDSPIKGRCGSCSRCIDACPTNALKNSSLDARRCISYLTIESKSEIPKEHQNKLSTCSFGCDICADACPWNTKWAKENSHTELECDKRMLDWDFETWLKLTEDEFNKTFRNSAIKRGGFAKLKQNINILAKELNNINH